MATKQRLAQLEKQKSKVKMTWKEFVESGELQRVLYERSMNTLADALGGTRAEVDKAMQELFSDKPTAKP